MVLRYTYGRNLKMSKFNPESQKYPEDKKKFDENWIRIFGRVCPACKGKRWKKEHDPELGALQGVSYQCPECNGIGKVEK